MNIEIEMENGGIIKAELYPDVAPITVENFVSLIERNFFDGLIFHRVIPGIYDSRRRFYGRRSAQRNRFNQGRI